MADKRMKMPEIKLQSQRSQDNTDVRECAMYARGMENGAVIIPEIELHNITTQRAGGPKYVNLRNKNRSIVPWTDEEYQALTDGVKKYGTGKWSVILGNNSRIFHPARRVIDLVNKYRQRTKASSFYTTTKKIWVFIDADGCPKKTPMGEIISFSDKFPYTAATKIAKLLDFSHRSTQDIQVREAESLDNIHTYRITRILHGFEIKKIVPRS